MKEEKNIFKDQTLTPTKKKKNTGKIRENGGKKQIKTDKF